MCKMRAVVLFLAVLPTFIRSVLQTHDNNIKYLLVKKPGGRFEVEYLLESERRNISAVESDVKFYFYSQSNVNDPAIFSLQEAKMLIKQSYFNLSKETLFLIHGWLNNYSSPFNMLIKDAVLEKYDVNLFVVDWGLLASENYITVFYNIPTIGKYVGQFMQEISSNFNYSFSRVKVVGHSLGAHVAGIAGKHINNSLDYIVGLDPAGPLFYIGNETDRHLCKDDARYVQVIHTCSKILGTGLSIGDADYYPNGGTYQSGCGFFEDLDGGCSHGRSYDYYAESVRNNGFIARKCTSYDDYIMGTCNNNTLSMMGGFYINKIVTGTFYLKTKEIKPYALGN